MTDLCDRAPEYVRAIAPYQPGKPVSELERELGIRDIVKLASNESPLGASPKALAAMQAALRDVARYPDGNGFELKAAISRRYGVGANQIVLGNGSNDVLELAARVFLRPGTAAVYSRHAFAVYPLVTQAMGATGIETPALDYGHDPDAMLRAITPETRIVFIANPNNPTGTLLAPGALRGFLRAAPREVLVVLDEAYTEYLPPELRGDSVAWLREFPNLVLTRTFSKAYGLAGLRVGFALAQPEVADLMNRVRQPFNVNSVAQAAAVAALDDPVFVERSFQVNSEGMVVITEGLARLGLEFIPSYGNFLSFRIGDAARAYRRLLELGVIVRPIGAYAMPQHLRVSIGLPAENQRFLVALEQVVREMGAPD
ncbi:MAG TPA: histidinol-phosphate transaminase [Burkholderiales bacterium]|nr:histidinol-phosphate transaminase [Burkholderiales bacterium]